MMGRISPVREIQVWRSSASIKARRRSASLRTGIATIGFRSRSSWAMRLVATYSRREQYFDLNNQGLFEFLIF
jgi:hypothetical protein